MDYEITAGETRNKLDSGEVVLLDVREQWERELVAIDPSTHIPMADIPAHMNELDPDKHIVVYCHRGVRSLNVALWLRQQGFENVQSMRGGIERWARDVDPTLKRY